VPEDRSILSRPGPAPDSQENYGPHPDQVIDWYLPAREDAGPVIVFIHGGYWRPEYDREHARSAAGGLAAAGFPTALIEYRRIPGQPDATVTDVGQAIRRAAAGTGGHPERPVIVIGHSAGGHLALLAAADPDLPITGTLALAPLADLRSADELGLDDDAARAFIGAPALERPDLDPCAGPTPTAPVVLVHGLDDSVVPAEMSRTYARRNARSVVEVPAAGHFELIDPETGAWVRILTELGGITTPSGIE
jgi:acetyl esterase/lipase